MAAAPIPSQEYWTKHITAQYLGLSVRRLMELTANRKTAILTRHKAYDPATKMEGTMFLRSEIEAYKQMITPQPVGTAAVATLARNLMGMTAPAAAPPAIPLQPWITIHEAAAVSGIPESVLLRLVTTGRLPALDCGPRPGGRYRVRRAHLDSIAGDPIGGGAV
jgi:excisionase family DNA binding protein